MNRNIDSPTGKPARYGYSCASCVQSKRKCIVREAGGPCQRCFKTNRECTPTKTVRQHNTKRPVRTSSSRLEEKIDSLVSLMKAGSQNTVLTSSAISAVESSSTSGKDQYDPVLHGSDSNAVDSLRRGRTSTVTSTPATTSSVCSFDIAELTALQSEEYLAHFLTFKLQYFPFIRIPLEMSSEQLRIERPFLWLCIMSISTKSTAQQNEISLNVRQIVAQEMVVKSEKSIDLLLGILGFIGWGNYQFRNKPFISVFTHLALSLVFDLGLNRPPQASKAICNLHQIAKPTNSGPRTMEERRAALACFLMISTVSSFLEEVDGLRWTPHMEESLQLLEEQKECTNDNTLVQLVRLQLILETRKLHRFSSTDLSEAPEDSKGQAAQFHELKINIFKSTPKDVVLLHLYNIELEVALSSVSLTNNELNADQTAILFPALDSINSWLEVISMLPPAQWAGLTFAIFSQISRCLFALFRLATLDSPYWDKIHVQNTFNPLLILNQFMSTLEQVPTFAEIDNQGFPNGDVFSRSAQILRTIRPEWEAKLGTNQIMASTIDSLPDINEVHIPEIFGDDIMYDRWFMDLLSSTF